MEDTNEVIELHSNNEQNLHNQIIQKVFIIGTNKGYNVHIGRTEQQKSRKFKEESFPLSHTQIGVSQETFKIIREIDVLWFLGNTITTAFEVEASTNITTGIQRFRELFFGAPNLTINCYILVPDNRRAIAINRINSPSNMKEGINKKINLATFSEISKNNWN